MHPVRALTILRRMAQHAPTPSTCKRTCLHACGPTHKRVEYRQLRSQMEPTHPLRALASSCVWDASAGSGAALYGWRGGTERDCVRAVSACMACIFVGRMGAMEALGAMGPVPEHAACCVLPEKWRTPDQTALSTPFVSVVPQNRRVPHAVHAAVQFVSTRPMAATTSCSARKQPITYKCDQLAPRARSRAAEGSWIGFVTCQVFMVTGIRGVTETASVSVRAEVCDD